MVSSTESVLFTYKTDCGEDCEGRISELSMSASNKLRIKYLQSDELDEIVILMHT